MLQVGQIIRWNKKECNSKRRFFEVIGEPSRVPDGLKYTLSPRYKPAPRSRLKTKTIFSKHKTKIIR